MIALRRETNVKKQCIVSGNAVPPEGVIGYDFFRNFTLVIDRLGGKLSFVKNNNKKETK